MDDLMQLQRATTCGCWRGRWSVAIGGCCWSAQDSLVHPIR